jgi:hypothetical protein
MGKRKNLKIKSNALAHLSDKEVSQNEKEYYDANNTQNLILTPTPFKTQYGRKVYKDQNGNQHSESSITVQSSNKKWMNIPSIYNGEYVNDDLAKDIIESNNFIDPETKKKIKTFDTVKEAVKEAIKRNRSLNNDNQSWNKLKIKK